MQSLIKNIMSNKLTSLSILIKEGVYTPAPVVNTIIHRNMSIKTPKKEDTPIHTGQQWDKEDYRMARFELAPKQVNTQWAAKLIAEVPPQKTNKRIVWCDGGSGPEGHPRVYINLDKPGNHSCGYCGLRFEKDGHH